MIGARPAAVGNRRVRQAMQDRRDADPGEIGDLKMPDFKMASTYAACQGWLIVQDDMLTLTTAGLAAA